MGDGGQHVGALRNMMTDTTLHRIKGARRLLDFTCSRFGKWWAIDILPKCDSRFCHLLQRTHRHFGNHIRQDGHTDEKHQ